MSPRNAAKISKETNLSMMKSLKLFLELYTGCVPLAFVVRSICQSAFIMFYQS